MRLAASILALAVCATPLGTLASDHTGSVSVHPAPAVRNAPPPRSAPVTRSAPVMRSAPVTRPAPVTRQPARPSRPAPTQPLPIYRARTPVTNPRPIPNPNTQPWNWNGGTAWVGYGGYWGNGFWGPLAYGLGAAAYIVAPGSPGAQLLSAYQLTQTPCGPPDLVEIYGPDGSEICAFPNALVAPGVYYVDYDTLTLYTQPPQNE